MLWKIFTSFLRHVADSRSEARQILFRSLRYTVLLYKHYHEYLQEAQYRFELIILSLLEAKLVRDVTSVRRATQNPLLYGHEDGIGYRRMSDVGDAVDSEQVQVHIMYNVNA